MTCNFDQGFKVPEMVKRRPVVIVSPKITARPGLSTVVALSTLTPNPVMPYHCQIDIRPKLPDHFNSTGVWVKGDMVCAVGFHRLDFIYCGKGNSGKRIYYTQTLGDENLKKIRICILRALGLAALTKHL